MTAYYSGTRRGPHKAAALAQSNVKSSPRDWTESASRCGEGSASDHCLLAARRGGGGDAWNTSYISVLCHRAAAARTPACGERSTGTRTSSSICTPECVPLGQAVFGRTARRCELSEGLLTNTPTYTERGHTYNRIGHPSCLDNLEIFQRNCAARSLEYHF